MRSVGIEELAAPQWAIEVRRLRWRPRGAALVLQDISFQVPHGSVLGLVGRNGAGKTSLMRCLAGMARPESGQCWLEGEESGDLSDAVRERVGYCSQTPVFFEREGPFEHLRRFASIYPNYPVRYAAGLLERLRVPAATAARDLSLGDRQKLNVVLALGHDPDVILLDEPVASLDPSARRECLRILFERPIPDALPRTILMSSHLLSDLERIATHVAFLRDGRLQLLDEWDAMTEQLRALRTGLDPAEWPNAECVRHRAEGATGMRWLIDLRRTDRVWPQAVALSLDDLFEEFNT